MYISHRSSLHLKCCLLSDTLIQNHVCRMQLIYRRCCIHLACFIKRLCRCRKTIPPTMKPLITKLYHSRGQFVWYMWRKMPVRWFDSYGAYQCQHIITWAPGIIIDIHDVIKWKHFPRYWAFVRGIHRSPADSTYKAQWRGAMVFFWFVNKRLSKLSRRRWFKTPSCSLRHRCNVSSKLFHYHHWYYRYRYHYNYCKYNYRHNYGHRHF